VLVGNGGATQTSEFHFGNVEITGRVLRLPASKIDRLTVAGRLYSQVKTLSKDVNLTLGETFVPLNEGGVIRKMSVTFSTTTGILAVLINNPSGGGTGIPLPKAGEVDDLEWIGDAGEFYPFNEIGTPKRLYLLTGLDLPAGAKMSITMEYMV